MLYNALNVIINLNIQQISQSNNVPDIFRVSTGSHTCLNDFPILPSVQLLFIYTFVLIHHYKTTICKIYVK